MSNGSLPPGITLDANTGVLSGTGTATGTYTFDITVTDEFGCSATNTYTIEVVCPVITIDQSTLPTIFTNTAYNETLTTTGGTSPFTYAVTSGSLPGGITLDPGGLLSGTTTAYGNYTITVTVTDANGCTGMQTFNITVDWPVSVKSLNANEETVVLLPNLVSTRTTAQIISNYSGKAIISIIDMAGRTVLQQNISLSAGENKVDLDLREIAAGTYTLHVQPIKVKPVKFLKQ